MNFFAHLRKQEREILREKQTDTKTVDKGRQIDRKRNGIGTNVL